MQEDRPDAAWIAADWGTTSLRAWAMDGAGRPLAEAGGAGMNALAPEGFAPELRRAVGAWLAPGGATPVVICGMAGAREGWRPAPYATVSDELRALGDRAVAPPCGDDLDVRILPGLKQDAPPDVMRGEETQLAGLVHAEPGFDGLAVLPGTHSKWARIAGGRVEAFRTAMTGELFALLSGASVLRHGMAGDGWDEAAFRDGVADALAAPAEVPARLFALRAAGLLQGLPPEAARARLSGLLIGQEIAALSPIAPGGGVTLVGAPGLCERYATAFAAAGRGSRIVDGGQAVRDGLALARSRLFGDAACAR